MSGSVVSIADRVACGKQLTTFSEVHTEVRERLIASSTVGRRTANDIFGAASSNARTESLNLTQSMRVLVEATLTKGAQEVEGSLLVKGLLEDELVRSLTKLIVMIYCQSHVGFLRRNGTGGLLESHRWSTNCLRHILVL